MKKYQNAQLYIEDMKASEIAKLYGTPCFVYSKSAICDNWHAFAGGFTKNSTPHKICYAVKANSNLAILSLLQSLGAGFDCVSGGEIARVLKAGGSPDNIVFSGVGKSRIEIEQALDLGIHSINIESEAELERVRSVACAKGLTASIAIRINPDIDANTHEYISTGKKDNKFGIDLAHARKVVTKAKDMSNIKLAGISCHIGSQITSLTPFLASLDCVLNFVETLSLDLDFINIGGGLGVIYKDEQPPTPQEYIQAILTKFGQQKFAIHIEPGRAIVANAGLMLTKVEYIKGEFAIVDSAMNDIIRPALYHSFHDIIPVQEREVGSKKYSVVGPVCETGDFFGKDRMLAIEQGDLLAVLSAGAYCFSMSSNYNSRPRAAEVLVDGLEAKLIRKRETIEELWHNEVIGA